MYKLTRAKMSLAILACLAWAGVHAQAAREFKDVVFATVDGKPLALDIYIPANTIGK